MTSIIEGRHAELVSASIFQLNPMRRVARWTLNQVQGVAMLWQQRLLTHMCNIFP